LFGTVIAMLARFSTDKDCASTLSNRFNLLGQLMRFQSAAAKTSGRRNENVRFGSLADILRRGSDVRLPPKADMRGYY
jgi:hypothetical protein